LILASFSGRLPKLLIIWGKGHLRLFSAVFLTAGP
jgi:hypothetical protein